MYIRIFKQVHGPHMIFPWREALDLTMGQGARKSQSNLPHHRGLIKPFGQMASVRRDIHGKNQPRCRCWQRQQKSMDIWVGGWGWETPKNIWVLIEMMKFPDGVWYNSCSSYHQPGEIFQPQERWPCFSQQYWHVACSELVMRSLHCFRTLPKIPDKLSNK